MSKFDKNLDKQPPSPEEKDREKHSQAQPDTMPKQPKPTTQK